MKRLIHVPEPGGSEIAKKDDRSRQHDAGLMPNLLTHEAPSSKDSLRPIPSCPQASPVTPLGKTNAFRNVGAQLPCGIGIWAANCSKTPRSGQYGMSSNDHSDAQEATL
jgi:hypothetical protein